MADTKNREESKEFVLRTVREKNIKFIRLWFTDIVGTLKGLAIMREELEQVMEEGIGFDGSSIEGFARIDESDMVAVPDPSTFTILPWRPQEPGVARMFCDLYTPDGKPFDGDSRFVLKRNLERAKEMGFTFYVGPELEYFYFKGSEDPTPVDKGGYFDQYALDTASDLRRETVLTLERMGIDVEYTHHEAAPGQEEIVLRYSDALTMADNTMTYRLAVKEIAAKYGVYATFMPKPIYGVNGSGMHTHQSLWREGQNAFFDPKADLHLSKVARSYIAGMVEHAPAITSITNQWVNSYKRLVPGFEAPTFVTWARVNRSDLIRVPQARPQQPHATRIEYRAPDSACNPYLAFAVMLAAGLDGVRRELVPPPAAEENVSEMSAAERERRGVKMLPGDLFEAIQLTEKSALVREALGDHVFESFIKNKKIEWDAYRSQVTDYEVQRYLPVL